MTPEEIKAYIDEQLEAKIGAIAELAVKTALNQIYTEVGRNVIKKATWVLGLVVFMLFAWLVGAGHVKP